ncbi:family 2 glycosyltransferase [Melampsora americana]|nr:family 2 glycosyltransferase [Melampsora americana]
MSYRDPFSQHNAQNLSHQERDSEAVGYPPIELSDSLHYHPNAFDDPHYDSNEDLSKYDNDQALDGDYSNEEIPLKSRGFTEHAPVGGFKVDGPGDGAYPPDIDPVKTFGFPIPSFSGNDDDTADSQYSSATNLYRSQTSAEAWGKRQRINPNRAKTIKVKLQQGNFVHEYPVPTPVLNANLAGGYSGEKNEFSHMRYSAVTCDPDDFTREAGWTLRTENYGRETQLLVAITYYNEDKILVARTLHGVMLNLRDMCKAKWSEFRKVAEKQTGTIEAWKAISVVLVFDGIEPADKATLDVLATIGLYQDGVMKREVDGKQTHAHVFEYTTLLSMSPKPELIQPHANNPANMVPVQMTLVLKQKNEKKINSHRWLFNAIGKHLDPEVCILIDAGTKPGSRSLYYLWEAFHHNPDLGGACGEIHAMLARGKKLINPLVAAQNFEYKVSSLDVLDKPLESSFGYVSVLPGAFSAYRFNAIQGRPLQQYFHGDHSLSDRLGKKGIQGMGIFKKNMFLAEDRILCFELVAKADAKWVLGYVKPAKGETDVPESAAELIGQRRRWLNVGSFAAGIYSLAHFPRMYKSRHNVIRMFFLHVQAFYTTFGLIMSWFSLANWYITFTAIIDIVHDDWRDPFGAAMITDYNMTAPTSSPTTTAEAQAAVAWKIKECWSGTIFDNSAHLKDNSVPSKFDWLFIVNLVLKMVYLALIALQVILALGNRPKGEQPTYIICFVIFGLFALYLLGMTLVLTIQAFCPMSTQIAEIQIKGGSAVGIFMGSTYGPIFAGLAGTFGIYIVSSFMYMDPWHIFHSMIPYLLVAVSFTNILNIYAFCNLHDVSWGTKGSDKVDALPAVSSKKSAKEGGAKVVEDIRRDQEDLDAQFQQTVLRAVQPFKDNSEPEKPNSDDQNKTFRTRFITIWLLTNSVLAIAISRLTSATRTYYFQGLLWSTFGLAAIRFCGFLYYMFGETVFRLARLCARTRR